jgi:hypothetical protein
MTVLPLRSHCFNFEIQAKQMSRTVGESHPLW